MNVIVLEYREKTPDEQTDLVVIGVFSTLDKALLAIPLMKETTGFFATYTQEVDNPEDAGDDCRFWDTSGNPWPEEVAR